MKGSKITISMLIALTMLAAGACAQQVIFYPATIEGTVYDSAGNPIEGASVVATCNAEGYTIPSVADTTDDDGSYGIWLDCPPGEEVTVVATYGDQSASNTGTLEQMGEYTGHGFITVVLSGAEIDVSLPEFPVALLPAMMSVFGVAFARKF